MSDEIERLTCTTGGIEPHPEGEYVSYIDYRECYATLIQARQLIQAGFDANFNEVGECEDDFWLNKIATWLQSATDGIECVPPYDTCEADLCQYYNKCMAET